MRVSWLPALIALATACGGKTTLNGDDLAANAGSVPGDHEVDAGPTRAGDTTREDGVTTVGEDPARQDDEEPADRAEPEASAGTQPPPQGVCPSVLVTVEVCTDGSDYLHVRDDALWWEHRDWELPGEHWECDSSYTIVDGDPWLPDWSGQEQGALSSRYSPLGAPLPSQEVTIRATSLSGRSRVSMTQQPAAQNDYEAVMLIDDDAPGGPSANEFVLSYGCD